MQLLDIHITKGEMLEWLDFPLAQHREIILPKATSYQLSGGWGSMIFQNIKRPYYDIWLSNYFTEKRITTHALADVAIIELSFLIEDSALYHLLHFGKVNLKATQFNITFIPYIDNRAAFEAGQKIATIDFHISFDLLEKLSLFFPNILPPFLDNVSNLKPCRLFPVHPFATEAMLAHLAKIIRLLHLPLTPAKAAALDNHVEKLLVLVLRYRNEMLYPRLQRWQRIAMRHLPTMLSGDLSLFPNVQALARKAGMNSNYLQKAFYEIYHTTPYQYWREHRMDAAFNEVKHSCKHFTEIAYEFGFSNIQNFTKAFVKQFHQTPTAVRFDK